MRRWQGQLLEALELLVRSFDEAADRDGRTALDAAVASGEVTDGLRTLLLRIVFVALAEARDLFPVRNRGYRLRFGLHTLARRLELDCPGGGSDGYWYLVHLWRALHGGAEGNGVQLPGYGGNFFAPDRYPFLEGRCSGQPMTAVPSIPNRELLAVLHLVLRIGTEPADYRTFDPHDFGASLEHLMGYNVIRLKSDAVRFPLRKR